LNFRAHRREEINVNLTPLIDVVFLLLIFFMVTTTFTKASQLSIDLPEATGNPSEAPQEQIEILVDESGNYRINGKPLVDTHVRTLQAGIYKVSLGDTSMAMVISADAQASHQSVVRAMDAAGQMGFVHLSIATQQTGPSQE
jgi:biopolymer transport protein ExbD